MGTATPVTATDAHATSVAPVQVKAIPDLTLPVSLTAVQPPIVESHLGGSYINNPQIHDSSNISACSSDLDTQENLKSHFNDRLSDKIYTTLSELFSSVNIDSVMEILPKINEYNREIAMFVEDINATYGVTLNYTQLEISEINHWVETFQVVANTCSQPEQQQPQVPQISLAVPSPQAPMSLLRKQ